MAAKEIVFLPAPQFSQLGPRDEQSIFKKMLSTLTLGQSDKLERSAADQFGRKRVSTFFETFREYSESSITGATLGFLDSKGMLEFGDIPVDGTVAAIGFAGRVIAGQDSGIGKTMGDIGVSGNTVFWFRMGQKWGGKKKSGVHGDDYNMDDTDESNDPVVQAAASL